MSPYTRAKGWCVIGALIFLVGLGGFLSAEIGPDWLYPAGMGVMFAGVFAFLPNWIAYKHMRDNPWERDA